MLAGKSVTLRPVRESDPEQLCRFHCAIDNRGAFYPRGIQGQPTFQKQFHENGLWSRSEGTLVITDPDDRIIAHIEF